MTSIT
ncbi:unnamed protein product [Gulo gulo]